MMSLRQEGPTVISLLADIFQGRMAKRVTSYIVDNSFSTPPHPPPDHTEQDEKARQEKHRQCVSKKKVPHPLCSLGWGKKKKGRFAYGFATLINHEQLLNKSHLFAKEAITGKEDVMQLFTSVMQI